MGRTERHRMERRERIEAKRSAVTMSRQELGELKSKLMDDVSSFNVEALMTCFALAEHRLYGFGPKRIMKTLNYIDELMGHVADDTMTVNDFKNQLKEETGVVIKCDD